MVATLLSQTFTFNLLCYFRDFSFNSLLQCLGTVYPHPYLSVQRFRSRHRLLLDKFYKSFLHRHIVGSGFIECLVYLGFQRCEVLHKLAALGVSLCLVFLNVLEKSLKALSRDDEPFLVRLVPVCYFVIHHLQLGLNCAYLDVLILLYVSLYRLKLVRLHVSWKVGPGASLLSPSTTKNY